MSRAASLARHAPLRRAAELALTARDVSRILAGARLADGQALRSLPVEADASLRDARSRCGLPPRLSLRDRLTTVGDVAVIELRDGPELAAILKLSRSSAGDACLLLQQETLRLLAADTRLGEWRQLLPDMLAHGVVGSRVYSIEKAVPGTVGTSIPALAGTEEASRNAVSAISGLHRATGRVEEASPARVDGWLEPALSLLADVPMLLSRARRGRLLDRLRERIRAGVEGRAVWVSRTHGDYFPGNIFYGPSGSVRGIIDWAQSRADDPAVIDPMTLIVVGRADVQAGGLGAVVRDLCRGASLSSHERGLLEAHRAACPADPLPVDVVALLAWARHVESNLLKSPRYAAHPAWVHRTIETVLRTAGGRG